MRGTVARVVASLDSRSGSWVAATTGRVGKCPTDEGGEGTGRQHRAEVHATRVDATLMAAGYDADFVGSYLIVLESRPTA
jgi:hypothetical protein